MTVSVVGISRWENLREFLMATVKRFNPDLLDTQETLAFQRDYLLEQLSGLEAVAAGRDDSKAAGEMAALFYRKDRFEAIESEGRTPSDHFPVTAVILPR